MFTSEGQAKRFFVEKITAQARFEGQPFSADEEWMLSFSELDPEFVVDLERLERLESTVAREEYETRVAVLLRRSYQRDLSSYSGAVDLYRDAYATLSRGDHYLLVMIEQALGSSVRAGRNANGVPRTLGNVGLFMLVGLPAGFTTLIAAGLTWIVVSGQVPSVREAVPFALGALVFAGMSYYLIRLWRREVRR